MKKEAWLGKLVCSERSKSFAEEVYSSDTNSSSSGSGNGVSDWSTKTVTFAAAVNYCSHMQSTSTDRKCNFSGSTLSTI